MAAEARAWGDRSCFRGSGGGGGERANFALVELVDKVHIARVSFDPIRTRANERFRDSPLGLKFVAMNPYLPSSFLPVFRISSECSGSFTAWARTSYD